jgi:eukaryotic-like serine/threonine-protein kinase
MGEVYKARDPRLDRIIALKVSKAEFTERFSREARTVAQLNHPHICTLHDVGPNYLVMEFVDGAPLKGPLPVEKALEYARQILDALDAAHRKGIVHRDLKPANIMVTKQGIKLLDFGLAQMEAGPDDETVAQITLAGAVMGTPGYAAPEQWEGARADARSDIYSFGCVHYEMLTGKRAAGTRAAVAPPLEDIVRTCLENDPDKRWQSAREVKHALEWMAQLPPSAAAPVGKLWKGLAAMLGLIALGLAAWMFWPKAEPLAQVVRFQVPLLEDQNGVPSLSPDGRKLVIDDQGAQGGLWIRDLDALEWRRLAGTEAVVLPFWSTDSRFLGFFSENQLKKVDVSGGPPQTLCTLPARETGGWAAWNRDGVIVYTGGDLSLWKISQTSCVPTALTAVDTARGETFHVLPTFMPDGKHFIYLRRGSPQVSGIYAGSLDAQPGEQPRERIMPAAVAASYANGHLFFLRENTLMAQPFDAGRLRFRGEPVPVADHVGNRGSFSVSASGALAWLGDQSGSYRLTWLDRKGNVIGAFGQPGADQYIVLSPDGARGAVRDADTDAAGDLWTLDFARGVRTRFTFSQSPGSEAVWSPDASRIAFGAGKDFDTIYEKASSGAGDERELLKEPGKRHVPTSWSRDGRFLLYYSGTLKTNLDLWVLQLQGDRKPALLLATPSDEMYATFSPDMRWIAYSSNESGRNEIYVRPFLASGPSGLPALGEGKWQVSKDGGDYRPRWTADGKQIVFQAPPHGTTKMAVDVTANGAALEIGVPQRLFQADDYGWDISPDGKRFLLAVPQGRQNALAPITVELNWPALLKKK